MYYFPLTPLRFLSMLGFQEFDYDVPRCSSFYFTLVGADWISPFFNQIWKIFSKYFDVLFSLSFPFETSITCMLDFLLLSLRTGH